MGARFCLIFTVRNEFAKVMFLQACVCPGGDVCLSACWDTTPWEQKPPHPPEQPAPPPEQTHPLEQTTTRSRHPPPGADPPGTDTPPEQTPPRPLLRTVRILLECILVLNCFSPNLMIKFLSLSHRVWIT